MRHTRTLLLGGLAGLAVLALSPLVVAQETDRAKVAVLRISLPPDAKLEIEGVQTKAKGALRLFQSPALEPGKGYTYTLKATWSENGKPVTVTRTVRVQAGKEFPVDLREADKTAGTGKPADTAKSSDTGKTAKQKPALGVHYVPTPQVVVDEMLKMAQVTDKDTVYDLGCGDGRIIVTAAKKYGAKGFGVDLDPERVKDTQENIKKNKVEKLVTVKEGDIFKTDVSGATVVTLYLLPQLNERLMPILKKQLKPGSRIVSHDFLMGDWKPVKEKELSDPDGTTHTIYMWKIEGEAKEGAQGKNVRQAASEALALLAADEKDKEPDVIYVPTAQGVVDRMLELAEVKKTDLVYDLGCGDARIVITAAKKYGCKAVGYDIDPLRIADSNRNLKLAVLLGALTTDSQGSEKGVRIGRPFPKGPAAQAGLKEGDVIKAMDSKAVANGRQLVELLKKKEHGDKVNFTVARNSENKEIALTSGSDEVDKRVTIEKKDIFTLDLSKAQVITLYLLPELNVKLIPQLEKLKPGCRIVSHDFDMRGVKPKKVERITTKDDSGNEREHTIYLWTTPLEKE